MYKYVLNILVVKLGLFGFFILCSALWRIHKIITQLHIGMEMAIFSKLEYFKCIARIKLWVVRFYERERKRSYDVTFAVDNFLINGIQAPQGRLSKN